MVVFAIDPVLKPGNNTIDLFIKLAIRKFEQTGCLYIIGMFSTIRRAGSKELCRGLGLLTLEGPKFSASLGRQDGGQAIF